MGKYEAFVHYGPYDKETIDNMYNVRFCGMPISFLLLDNRKTNTYCHFCASLLTFVIPGSKRVEGKLTTLDGSDHSWVEVGDVVYDTTEVLMWDKKSYYEKDGVLSSFVVSDEDVHESADMYLENSGFTESFVAWIEDLESNMENNIYRRFLSDHIERFKKEIDYDNLVVDQGELREMRLSLNKMYGEINRFISENPVKNKRKD